jgi:hypothetical protein
MGMRDFGVRPHPLDCSLYGGLTQIPSEAVSRCGARCSRATEGLLLVSTKRRREGLCRQAASPTRSEAVSFLPSFQLRGFCIARRLKARRHSVHDLDRFPPGRQCPSKLGKTRTVPTPGFEPCA